MYIRVCNVIASYKLGFNKITETLLSHYSIFLALPCNKFCVSNWLRFLNAFGILLLKD